MAIQRLLHFEKSHWPETIGVRNARCHQANRASCRAMNIIVLCLTRSRSVVSFIRLRTAREALTDD